MAKLDVNTFLPDMFLPGTPTASASAPAQEPTPVSAPASAPVRVLQPFRPTLNITLVPKDGPFWQILDEIVPRLNEPYIQARKSKSFELFMKRPDEHFKLHIIANYIGQSICSGSGRLITLDSTADNFAEIVELNLKNIRLLLLTEGIEANRELVDRYWFRESPRLQLKIQYLKDNNYLHRVYMSEIDNGFETYIDRVIAEMEASF